MTKNLNFPLKRSSESQVKYITNSRLCKMFLLKKLLLLHDGGGVHIIFQVVNYLIRIVILKAANDCNEW